MVSLAAQLGRPLVIFLHHQASKLVSICWARSDTCRTGPHRSAALPHWKMTPQTHGKMSPPWGWAGAASAALVGSPPRGQTLHWFPHGCQRHEGVPWWRVTWTLIAIGGHLAVTQDVTITLTNLCILIIVESILFHVGGLRSNAGFLVIFSGPGVGRT